MKKRILIALSNYDRGGIARSLKNLLDVLGSCDLEIDVYCGNPTGIFKGEMKNCRELKPCYLHKVLSENLRVVKGWKKIQALFWKSIRHLFLKIFHWDLLRLAAYFIARKISKEHYDAAIAYCDEYPAWWVAQADVSRKLIWIHNDYSCMRADEICHPDWEKFDKIICVSRSSQKAFCEIFPQYEDKVEYFYNITSVNDVIEKSKCAIDDTRFETRNFTIVSIGRIAAVKNFNIIPSITRNLIENGIKNFKWYIIGNGSDLETSWLVSAITENEVAQHVILLGEKRNPYPYLKRADLFVCTSLSESYGIVIDEAKILGIPILSTNYNAVHEVLSEKYGKIADIKMFTEILSDFMIHPEKLNFYRENLRLYKPDSTPAIQKFISFL